MGDAPAYDDLSLEQIEQDYWGDAPADATRLVRTAHELRRKPIGTLNPEDLRLLISQDIGIEVLMPRALAVLEQDPLVEGDFFPGDVLAAVLKAPATHWRTHPDQLHTVRKIISAVNVPDDFVRERIERFVWDTATLA